jgi:cardiolipin synthase A/B
MTGSVKKPPAPGPAPGALPPTEAPLAPSVAPSPPADVGATPAADRDAVDPTAAGAAAVPQPEVPPGERNYAWLLRNAKPGLNEALIRKSLEFLMAGGVTARKQLVHEHPFVEGNDVQFLIDGGQAFPPLLDDVRAAKKTIYVSFYIFKDDKLGNELADLLIEKAKAGVEVNLSLDGIGSVDALWNPARRIVERMAAGGVKVVRNHVFDITRSTTALNHPDHRKLVLIDGVVGYTGGMNIADHYRDGYHDIMIRVTGPVVQQMTIEWALSFSFLGGKLAVKGKPEDEAREYLFPRKGEEPQGGMRARVIQGIPGDNPEIFRETLRLIGSAKRVIRIENPYCTNPEIQNALIEAARRGVEVEIILPGESDHGFSHLAAKAAYPKMIEAGIKIYEYPGFNHDKVMVIDDRIVSVGSSNFDDVALRHIYELNLIVEDPALARDVARRLFDVDRKKSKLMKAEEISTLQRLTGSFWNLFHDII